MDRPAIIVLGHDVRRPYLDEARPGKFQYVRHAEAAADLYLFAARYYHFLVLGDGGQGEEDAGCVVVDDQGGLGSGEHRRQVMA
jgi:hypothetical protein